MRLEQRIANLRREPERAQELARFLLSSPSLLWTEWELDFLEAMARGRDHVSTAQAEKLLELLDGSNRSDKKDGFSAKLLVDDARLNRDAFEDERMLDFLDQLVASGYPALTERQWRYLFACARVAGSVESYIAAE